MRKNFCPDSYVLHHAWRFPWSDPRLEAAHQCGHLRLGHRGCPEDGKHLRQEEAVHLPACPPRSVPSAAPDPPHGGLCGEGGQQGGHGPRVGWASHQAGGVLRGSKDVKGLGKTRSLLSQGWGKKDKKDVLDKSRGHPLLR